jgi:hypothetical protein
MWFLLFSTGAILVGLAGVPWTRRLPAPPAPEAVLAAYFLVAALLRLLIRDARLAAFERKARRLARRQGDPGHGPSLAGHLGRGVGLGALQAVGGDFISSGFTLLAALFRGAATTVAAPPGPARERRRSAAWERLRTVASIAGTGLVCAAMSWAPLFRGRLVQAASAAVKAAGLR